MRVHFIAIGGSAMHNLALALEKKGYRVTGSDDEIFEPSKGRLAAKGLLPDAFGWFPERITPDIDAIILGMHAREDNPELLKAKELGLPIYSYPEYLYEQSKDKVRVVIGGSHGKTTITAMILHVLGYWQKDFDYMVGAQLDGFDTMVKISESAPVMILEGDEYLSSPIDRQPKFHLYNPHIALLSGIAWDHINVFPTFENYVDQFRIFINKIEDNGTLVWCQEDPELVKLVEESDRNLKFREYTVPNHVIRDGVTYWITEREEVPLQVFGHHNLQNLNGARLILRALGISDEKFFAAIPTFSGAAKRLEKIAENDQSVIYKDFAHSPSKLKATTQAVKAQFPDRELIACMELHTFSSLNKEFLDQYDGAMNEADRAFVYFNPHTLKHKRLPDLSKEAVQQAFGREDIEVLTESSRMQEILQQESWSGKNLLLMSSGNFDGIDLNAFGQGLLSQ